MPPTGDTIAHSHPLGISSQRQLHSLKKGKGIYQQMRIFSFYRNCLEPIAGGDWQELLANLLIEVDAADNAL